VHRLHEHAALRQALGCEADRPSVYACYRFAAKLRRYKTTLDACIARVLSSLRIHEPDMGCDLAIDASDLPAYANGQRFVSKGGREGADSEFSDRDASWGHRSAVSTRKGGGFYGYKVDMATCARTGLPVAWNVRTARDAEAPSAAPLLDAARTHGFIPGNRCDGQGLRRRAGIRRLRGARHPSHHPAPRDARREARGG